MVELSAGKLVYVQPPSFREDIAPMLRDGLLKATGQRWQVERGAGEGAPTLYEAGEAAKSAAEDAVRRAPLVEAAFAAFPDAKFVKDDDEPAYQRGNRNWSRR